MLKNVEATAPSAGFHGLIPCYSRYTPDGRVLSYSPFSRDARPGSQSNSKLTKERFFPNPRSEVLMKLILISGSRGDPRPRLFLGRIEFDALIIQHSLNGRSCHSPWCTTGAREIRKTRITATQLWYSPCDLPGVLGPPLAGPLSSQFKARSSPCPITCTPEAGILLESLRDVCWACYSMIGTFFDLRSASHYTREQ